MLTELEYLTLKWLRTISDFRNELFQDRIHYRLGSEKDQLYKSGCTVLNSMELWILKEYKRTKEL